jgi:hypothetical protein
MIPSSCGRRRFALPDDIEALKALVRLSAQRADEAEQQA